ncbi:MAG: hypothetical protein P3X22_005020 [Thermoprotei archaeon]|nr:hypothetical protein [Thermoprotei archaeon]
MESRVVEVMAKIPCGSNTECYMDLKEYLELYAQLHELIDSINIEVEVERGKYPLMEGVKNVEEVAGKTAEVLKAVGVGIDEAEIIDSVRNISGRSELGHLASYVFRRIAFRGLRNKMGSPTWISGRCPVCGLTPITGIYRKVPHEFYTQTKLELYCLCGFSLEHTPFNCPSCGNSDRSRFEVLLLNKVKIQRCMSCGHMIAIIDEDPFIFKDLAHVIAAYSIVRVMSAEERQGQ